MNDARPKQEARRLMSGELFKEAFIEADGFRIRYVEAGNGHPVICLHGGGGLRLAGP